MVKCVQTHQILTSFQDILFNISVKGKYNLIQHLSIGFVLILVQVHHIQLDAHRLIRLMKVYYHAHINNYKNLSNKELNQPVWFSG